MISIGEGGKRKKLQIEMRGLGVFGETGYLPTGGGGDRGLLGGERLGRKKGWEGDG